MEWVVLSITVKRRLPKPYGQRRDAGCGLEFMLAVSGRRNALFVGNWEGFKR
jgi:hypothetical protein